MSDGRNLLFTSDLHLGHANIIKHCNRPFTDVDDMNRSLFWDLCIEAGGADMLYILGDFSFMPWETTEKALRRLTEKCPVTLICGNHDARHRKRYETCGLLAGVYDLLEIKYNKQHIVLCHYPLRTWNRSHHGSWHLHGHSHGSLPAEGLKRLDVGVDAHNYQPLTIAQVCGVLG